MILLVLVHSVEKCAQMAFVCVLCSHVVVDVAHCSDVVAFAFVVVVVLA